MDALGAVSEQFASAFQTESWSKYRALCLMIEITAETVDLKALR